MGIGMFRRHREADYFAPPEPVVVPKAKEPAPYYAELEVGQELEVVDAKEITKQAPPEVAPNTEAGAEAAEDEVDDA